jgi:hypothetical protein
VGTLVVTAPWWSVVVARHGFEPFTSAGGGSSITGNWLRIALLPLVSGNAPLALIGAFVCLRKRDLFLPVWLLMVLMVTGEFRTYVAAPLALLSGVGVAALPWERLTLRPRAGLVAIVVVSVLLAVSWFGMATLAIEPLVNAVGPLADSISRKVLGQTGDFRSYLAAPLAVLGTTMLLVWASLRVRPPSIRGASAVLASLAVGIALYGMLQYPVEPVLEKQDRVAMAWIAGNSEPDDRFLVMSGTPYWGFDAASEWFGALSGRVSVATPQGSEWVGQRSRMDQLYQALQTCATEDATCIEEWATERAIEFDGVFIPSTPAIDHPAPRCCAPLEASLRTSSAYAVAYDAPGAVVFMRVR